MQETQVRCLSWKDPLEKEMAAHSSILAWEIPWTEEPGRLQSMGLQRVWHNLVTKQQKLTITLHHTCFWSDSHVRRVTAQMVGDSMSLALLKLKQFLGRGHLPPAPLESCGWTNDPVDTRKVNRQKRNKFWFRQLLYFLDKDTTNWWGIDRIRDLDFGIQLWENLNRVWAWGSQL